MNLNVNTFTIFRPDNSDVKVSAKELHKLAGLSRKKLRALGYEPDSIEFEYINYNALHEYMREEG